MNSGVRHIAYEIGEVEPYINWIYFDYAWGVGGKAPEERDRLRGDAARLLRELDGNYHTHALFGIFDAHSEGDDIIVGDVRIPMLRQQTPHSEGQPCLCLSDFIAPASTSVQESSVYAQIGVFAATVDRALTHDMAGDDPYQKMLVQTVADRLAEATAEKLHHEVRTRYWGYAPDEQLTMSQIHAEQFQGIRPAIGYPSLPDTSVNFILSDLLDMKQIDIRLTESGMMTPHASVSGFMFAHPQAHYFSLGKIGEDQLRDYARRRGVPVELMRGFLANSILKS